VTSVGATSGVPEVSASFSTGGFSNVFARPAYQEAAVSGYLSNLGDTYSGLFNATGRAFPDVSAMGNNVAIVVNQTVSLAAGTSCSTPIFASLIALLNDELVAAGMSPLGFLNPFIYANADAFNDMTTGEFSRRRPQSGADRVVHCAGSNPGCNTTGFPATTGWDPVSDASQNATACGFG